MAFTQKESSRNSHLQLVLLDLSLQSGNLVAHVAGDWAGPSPNKSLCLRREYGGRGTSQ